MKFLIVLMCVFVSISAHSKSGRKKARAVQKQGAVTAQKQATATVHSAISQQDCPHLGQIVCAIGQAQRPEARLNIMQEKLGEGSAVCTSDQVEKALAQVCNNFCRGASCEPSCFVLCSAMFQSSDISPEVRVCLRTQLQKRKAAL